MSNIKNIPKKKNFLLQGVRSTLEHRATWFYLLLKEAEKNGVLWETIGYPAIKECGLLHGGQLTAAAGTKSLMGLKKTLFTFAARQVFEMKILKSSHDELSIEFGYCPLVAAWQKLGCTDKDIVRLCDMAMEGDRGIAQGFGGQLLLGDTIAKGHDVCQIRFCKGTDPA